MTTQIPESAFEDLIKELQERPLAENKYRTTAGDGRSQAFGIVNRRSLPADWSRQNWLRPKLYKLLKDFADKYVSIPYTSITVNQNYQAAKHRDKGNVGNSLLVAFGSYTGGELEILEGDAAGTHDIRHKPIIADFSKAYHQVLPFQGERYSLVFYTIKNIPVGLPEATVKEENGKYVFYRGKELMSASKKKKKPQEPDYKFTRTEGSIWVRFD